MTTRFVRRSAISAVLVTAIVAAAVTTVFATGGGDPSSHLRVIPLDARSVRLEWTPAAEAESVQVWRDGRLVDQVSAHGRAAYVDHGLWQATRYRYTVLQLGPHGHEVSRGQRRVTTPERRGAYPRLYATTSFVNQPIVPEPRIDRRSAAIVARAILPAVPSANFADSDEWGVPVLHADVDTRRYAIRCTDAWCGATGHRFPVPAGATPSTGSDHHMVVLDPEGRELDLWVADRHGGRWDAGAGLLTRADGTGIECGQGERCTAANAAGFALAAGIVRPEEIAQGHIDHALLLTVPYTRAGFAACPAHHTDGRHADPAAIPLGARIQLDPAVDVDQLPVPEWQKVIARALQEYGAYVGDTGGSLAVRAESNAGRGYDAWRRAGVPANAPSLRDLPWDHVRVLRMTRCRT